MRNRSYLFWVLCQVGALAAETNGTETMQTITQVTEHNVTQNALPLTLDHLDKLSNILEPSAEVLSTQINLFGIYMTVFIALLSFLGYIIVFKPMIDLGKSTSERIQRQFDQAEKKLDKELSRMEKMIEREVENQIVYALNGKIDKAIAFADDKLDYEINKIKDKVRQQMFDYQECVYEVNQHIVEESETLLQRTDIDTEKKLHKIMSLQYRYNEITNHYVPKLFRDNIKEIIPAAKALSEYQQIKHIIQLHLLDLLHKNIWSNAEKAELQKVIDRYYGKNGDERA